MNNLSKDLKWLYENLKDILTKPRVIAQSGSAGHWYYKKWSDGTLECWLHREINHHAVGTQWGSLYYSEISKPENYPVTFLVYPTVITTLQSSTGNCFSTNNNTNYSTSNPGSMFALSPSKLTDTNLTINYYVVGRWK